MSHEWIYLEEELPEIQIRAVVEAGAALVAMPEEDIYNQLILMFRERPGLADAFFELHKEATVPKDHAAAYLAHLVYHVNARRKDLGSTESEKDYFDTLRSTKRVPNYRVLDQILAELQEPFETAGELVGPSIRAPHGARLRIRLESGDETMALETDRTDYDIVAGEFHRKNVVESMYLGERSRMAGMAMPPAEGIVPVADETDFHKFSRSLLPSMDSMPMNLMTDLRSLQVVLEQHGRSLDDLDTETLQAIANRKAPVEKEKKTESKEAPRGMPGMEMSYVQLHKLFWDSMLHRATVATDAPLYANLVEQSIAQVMSKPFRAELYMPLSKQLEGLENGSIKLEGFIHEIQLLRNLDERILLNSFRDAVKSLESAGDLTTQVKDRAQAAAHTVDPEQAQAMFGTKAFLKTYTDTEHQEKTYPPEEESGHYVVEQVHALVENPTDEIEEEENDELRAILAEQPDTPLVVALREISGVLARLRDLTNMPWDAKNFVRMLIQRAPPMMDIAMAMYEIDSTMPKEVLDAAPSGNIQAALALLPMEKHLSIKGTYQKALARLQDQKRTLFFMFLSCWVLHIQMRMLDDLFRLTDITNSPCKSELTGLGFPIEDGKKGVLSYFVCVLHEEGHDIPNMKPMVDGYSKDQLSSMVKEGFEHFAHEIDEMKTRVRIDVVYQGSLQVEEANQAYESILQMKGVKNLRPRDLLKPYVKSLQLLPSIMGDVKERHKHILGCCYTRLDSSFLAANNLKSGLKASRNYFARESVRKKARPALAYYGKPMPTVDLKETPARAVPEVEEAPMATDWKEEVSALPLVPDRVRSLLAPENRQMISKLNEEARRYLEALHATTSMPMEKTWTRMQAMTRGELMSILASVQFDIYLYMQQLDETDYQVEVGLVRDAIGRARDTTDGLKRLSVPEEESEELRALMLYIVCRVACLPGDVEPSMTTLSIGRVVKANFLQNMARYMVRELRKHMELRSVPTLEEIAKKMSEIREKRKIETIRAYEANPELNRLLKQARLQGIDLDVDATAAPAPNMLTEDDRADLEGALEFQMPSENPDEMNDDSFYDM